MTQPRRISIITPCRNERDYIAGFVESLLAQELPPHCALEVLVADGMSDDGTRQILDEFSTRHPTLSVVSNPGRIVSTGLNAAIRASSGDVIVRMDAHTTYARDYLRRCVETLDRTGADNVGVRGGRRVRATCSRRSRGSLTRRSRRAGAARTRSTTREKWTPSTSAAGAEKSSTGWDCSTKSWCATRTTS
jgi:glycosyltransferase involved in cell wall biosynthesis